MMKKVFSGMFVLLVVVCAVGGKQEEEEEVNHVVGGEDGWHSEANVGSWSSKRLFHVGDKLLFSYQPALESVVELQTLQEYLSCDLTSPIKMYSDGMTKVSLEEEKVRYFASGTLESCKNGLKLQTEVLAKEMAAATGPTPSKASTNINSLFLMSLFGLSISILGQ